MDNRYTGVFEQVDGWWIGYVEKLPGCNVQERSLEETRESLREAVQLIVQANRELARQESEGHQVLREALAVPAVEALAQGVGLGPPQESHRDLGDIVKTWEKDRALEQALADQDRIDEA